MGFYICVMAQPRALCTSALECIKDSGTQWCTNFERDTIAERIVKSQGVYRGNRRRGLISSSCARGSSFKIMILQGASRYTKTRKRINTLLNVIFKIAIYINLELIL